MKLIIFGKFSFKHIYFLFYAISTFLTTLFSELLFEYSEIYTLYFYQMYLLTLANFISIIPFLINRKLTKRINQEKIEQKDNIADKKINVIYNIKNNITSKEIIKVTLRVTIFYFLAYFIMFLFNFINDDPKVIYSYSLQTDLIFNTVTQYLVSHFVLNYNFYSHHYLSFGINILCTLILLIIDIINIVNKGISSYKFYIHIFIKMIRLFLLALGDNYAKITLYKYFLSPFSLMLFMAIQETVILIIITILFIFIKSKATNEIIFKEFSGFFSGINLLYNIVLLIFVFFYDAFLLILIDRFSPSHLPLEFILYSFLYNIYFIIKNKIKNGEIEYYLYVNIFIYIILFIAAMVHNEIFIINRCGLNANTKLFLDYKLEQERKENEILSNKIDMDYYYLETKNAIEDEKLIPLDDLISND